MNPTSQTPSTLTIRRPDDWHLHLRDGDALRAVVADTARQFSRAIIMPNLRPPVTTVEQAVAYRNQILKALQQRDEELSYKFEPLMTLYLTDNTSVDDVQAAASCEHVYAFKLYPAGATTNSDSGVTDLLGKCRAVLDAMQRLRIPLLVHGEVTDPNVDVFDREAVFVDRVMIPLRKDFPELKVVFEHITTRDGAHYVRDAQGPIAATITPQHLMYNRNAIFQGGLRPHWYCLPILKRELHRQALLEVATGDSPRFFLGTDSAPHARGLKEQDCGCAGCYNALHAMALYAQAFESVGRLDRLEAFASLRGPAFYDLPVNDGSITLIRQSYVVPEELPYIDGDTLVPLAAGQALTWRLQP
ncbi:dihydroorotase [Orrella marina]|uniref:Dihydroorotase n=1 Tax=Orrella marina TaxID=2163011 RepID=A0A2R4XKI6_9BURK|nr:dihydroorotase [Orrella marina]AWB34284.1 dihydroorotase [Orrella marina]